MTIINLICPELSDIKAIRLECPRACCGAIISLVPQKWEASALDCPNCGYTLIAYSNEEASAFKVVDQFAKGLKGLLQLAQNAKVIEKEKGKRTQFRLRLEFQEKEN